MPVVCFVCFLVEWITCFRFLRSDVDVGVSVNTNKYVTEHQLFLFCNLDEKVINFLKCQAWEKKGNTFAMRNLQTPRFFIYSIWYEISSNFTFSVFFWKSKETTRVDLENRLRYTATICEKLLWSIELCRFDHLHKRNSCEKSKMFVYGEQFLNPRWEMYLKYNGSHGIICHTKFGSVFRESDNRRIHTQFHFSSLHTQARTFRYIYLTYQYLALIWLIQRITAGSNLALLCHCFPG